MAKWWQKLRSCPGEPQPEFHDDRLECSLYCAAGPAANARLPMHRPAAQLGPAVQLARARREAARQSFHSWRPVLKMCGMKNVGHDLNTPYTGYAFDVAW
jgi:hypothetical protein